MRASDAFGNESVFPVTPSSVQVDPAVGMSVAAGVQIRTFFEKTEATLVPNSITGDGTSLFVLRSEYATGDVEDIVQVAGVTSGALTAFSLGAFPASTAMGGFLHTPAAFGPSQFFYTLEDEIAALSSTNAYLSFSTSGAAVPWDVAFGNQGAGDRIFYTDLPTDQVFAVDNAGSASLYTSTGLGGFMTKALTFDAANTRLLLARGTELYEILDNAGSPVTNLITGGLPAGDPFDIAISNGKALIPYNAYGSVQRVTLAGVVEASVSDQFRMPIAVHADGTTLWVLDREQPSNGNWRILRVTGH